MIATTHLDAKQSNQSKSPVVPVKIVISRRPHLGQDNQAMVATKTIQDYVFSLLTETIKELQSCCDGGVSYGEASKITLKGIKRIRNTWEKVNEGDIDLTQLRHAHEITRCAMASLVDIHEFVFVQGRQPGFVSKPRSIVIELIPELGGLSHPSVLADKRVGVGGNPVDLDGIKVNGRKRVSEAQIERLFRFKGIQGIRASVEVKYRKFMKPLYAETAGLC